MALQYSVNIRDAQANQIESTIGASPILEIRTGNPPANTSAVDSGILLVSMTLPADWLGVASNGAVSKLGTWSATASAGGTAGHFRIKDSTGTTVHIQGTVTATGGGGDMELDNTNIASGQTVTINAFSITVGNA